MGEVRTIRPNLRFPKGVAFQVKDQFNGESRGTWYYRDKKDGKLFGPYMTEAEAAFVMEATVAITPYSDTYHYWWWDTPGGETKGPFRTFRDAEVSILEYLNGEKK
ncbi:hypothetical protein LAV_00055 [Sphingobium phage Lacusarx]|uniref:Uncharacterized protein n=1 Tax=Sphingobium phage Lacusarx TaxID=1980139 RepID=A0A1W6DX29_9CAUD|nr:hypothetical protein FDH44_gp055 [Sphingobium phage Lacusarx]ARK07455.1 hypothetical protein LAV_00055 [Sphingobium phage Lacusarx]